MRQPEAMAGSDIVMHHTVHLSHPSSHSTSTSFPSVRPDENNDPEKALTPQVSRVSRPDLARVATNGTTGTTDPDFEVDWEGDDDSDNPRNFPLWYRCVILVSISWSTFVYVPSHHPMYLATSVSGLTNISQCSVVLYQLRNFY